MNRAREVAKDTRLSPGARLLYQILLHAQVRADRRAARSGNPALRAAGGTVPVREVGRPYLAAKVGRCVRTVTRYIAELREVGGYMIVIPPVLTLTAAGWRTIGTNRYVLLTGSERPAGRRHRRRPRRGDTGSAAPAPAGASSSAGRADDAELLGSTTPAASSTPPVDHAARIAEVRATLAKRRRWRSPP